MPPPPHRPVRIRGVAGVLLALLLATVPALTSAPAHAASTKTWDRLAMCESSGNWSINTGNGYYGGLQFYQPTWVGFGGTAYAKRAHRATRAQQIKVAERVLAVQGWRAWPACSLKLGLRKPTRAEKRAEERAQRQAEKKAAAKAASGKKKKAGAKKSTAGKKQKPDQKAGKKTGKKAGKKAGKKTQEKASSSAKRAGRRYTVRVGDSLRSIAAAKRIPGGWPTLYRLNRGVLRSPHDIRPGQRIRLRR